MVLLIMKRRMKFLNRRLRMVCYLKIEWISAVWQFRIYQDLDKTFFDSLNLNTGRYFVDLDFEID